MTFKMPGPDLLYDKIEELSCSHHYVILDNCVFTPWTQMTKRSKIGCLPAIVSEAIRYRHLDKVNEYIEWHTQFWGKLTDLSNTLGRVYITPEVYAEAEKNTVHFNGRIVEAKNKRASEKNISTLETMAQQFNTTIASLPQLTYEGQSTPPEGVSQTDMGLVLALVERLQDKPAKKGCVVTRDGHIFGAYVSVLQTLQKKEARKLIKRGNIIFYHDAEKEITNLRKRIRSAIR